MTRTPRLVPALLAAALGAAGVAPMAVVLGTVFAVSALLLFPWSARTLSRLAA